MSKYEVKYEQGSGGDIWNDDEGAIDIPPLVDPDMVNQYIANESVLTASCVAMLTWDGVESETAGDESDRTQGRLPLETNPITLVSLIVEREVDAQAIDDVGLDLVLWSRIESPSLSMMMRGD